MLKNAERTIDFPIDGRVNSLEGLDLYSVRYAWQCILSAAANADRKTYRKVGSGINTTSVHNLLTTYVEDIPIHDYADYEAYDRGEVLIPYGSKDDWDHQHRERLTYADNAFKTTLSEAGLDGEVRQMIENGHRDRLISQYFYELIGGIKDQLNSSDFPYRSFKNLNNAMEFWNYLINGDEKRPGLIRTAATIESRSKHHETNISRVFGPQHLQLAQQALSSVLYLQTSNRKPKETTRSILTPLLQSFNTRDISRVLADLREFVKERPELVNEGFHELLEINTTSNTKIIDDHRADDLAPVSSDRELSDLINSLGEDEEPQYQSSKLDKSVNEYVNKHRWHTYYIRRGRKYIVLTEAADRYAASNTSFTPRLYFFVLDQEGRQKGVHKKSMTAREFFRKIDQKLITKPDRDTESLKLLALSLDDTEARLKDNLLLHLKTMLQAERDNDEK